VGNEAYLVVASMMASVPKCSEEVMIQLAELYSLANYRPIKLTNEGMVRWAFNGSTNDYSWIPYINDPSLNRLTGTNFL